MNTLRVMRGASSCKHRPPDGSIPIEPGLWWSDRKQTLWVGGETWLDERTHLLFGCLLLDFHVPGADLCEAIGRVALSRFLSAFPDAVPASAKRVICDVCDHKQGGEVG